MAGERGAVESGLHARQPKAIHSAFTVLEEVARCGPGVTAREISASLRMSRATAYRLLNLLVQEEYLVRLGDLSGFALGRKVAELAHLVAPPRPPQAVRDIVASVREHLRGGVHLVGYAGSTLRVLDEDPEYRLTDAAKLSRDLELSAMGRLLLADLRREAGADAGAGFVAETIARGFAVQTGSFDPARGCLAFPIRDGDGRLVASLSLCTARERVEHPGRLLDELRDGAARLGPLLS
ncbi:helix-turn-helix domain-containing protein [Agromyces bauzanensis]